ncbi:hypothetical protein [Salibaculum sp.]|uniref:hypothetical protein n=1 Tax=Salibaculum sp. TaxID=2855480 RepID=UPI002B4605C8|nr:hypothetical protein [Salibaculum sp.]HKL70043.1 hypothetical protein [Salibaculum sp.]
MRPEIKTLLLRWREALIGLGVTALGLYWGLASFGILQWLGWALGVAGLALVVTGVQRGRFRRAGDGPGIVTIRERRVAYMGPEAGGLMDMDALARLELHPDGPDWVLVGEDGSRLAIPADARGADGLFDVFAALPGVGLDHLLQALDRPGREARTLWTREAPGARRLH